LLINNIVKKKLSLHLNIKHCKIFSSQNIADRWNTPNVEIYKQKTVRKQKSSNSFCSVLPSCKWGHSSLVFIKTY